MQALKKMNRKWSWFPLKKSLCSYPFHPSCGFLPRFCEEVFHGPLSVQEQWIAHLQKHILSLGYKGKASPPAAPVETPALVPPVAV